MPVELTNLANVACPRCYGMRVYHDSWRHAHCCAACGLVATEAELQAGYDVLWRRAGVLAYQGARPEPQTRSACPQCFQIDKLMPVRAGFVDMECARCRIEFRFGDMVRIPEALAVDFRDPSGALVMMAPRAYNAEDPVYRIPPTLEPSDAEILIQRKRFDRVSLRAPEPEPEREPVRPGKRRIRVE